VSLHSRPNSNPSSTHILAEDIGREMSQLRNSGEHSSRAKFSNHFHGCQQIICSGFSGPGVLVENRTSLTTASVSDLAKGHSPEEKEEEEESGILGHS